MHPIICIVGKSGSGKTTLLEALIAELKGRGHKVAMVKHTHHNNDLDIAKKDTWRFTKAGSEISVINSLDHLAVYRRMDYFFDPQEISRFILWDYDIILTEGFKGSHYPKIEVHNSQQGDDLLTDITELLAVVTDKPLDVDVPQFSRDEVGGIADLIEERIRQQPGGDVDLVVNGVSAPVNSELGDLLTRTLTAMIPRSPNDGEIKSLHLSLRRKP
jgi:molybdopterin-guanine dinucleotide biosynthesis protein B